jgi:hypothetical protein
MPPASLTPLTPLSDLSYCRRLLDISALAQCTSLHTLTRPGVASDLAAPLALHNFQRTIALTILGGILLYALSP